MLGAHAIEVGPLGMLAINISLLAMVGWALLRAERGLPDGREWALLAMLAIFGIFGRVLLEPLPNIQPVTVLVLLVGVHMGAKRSIALAAVIALGSNMLMGHGLWTLYQALGWSLVGCLGAFAATHLNTLPRIAGTAASPALTNSSTRHCRPVWFPVRLGDLPEHPAHARSEHASCVHHRRPAIRPAARDGQPVLRRLVGKSAGRYHQPPSGSHLGGHRECPSHSLS